MSVWEEVIGRPLRLLHLDSIRGKILAFAALATLIPTLVTTVASYRESRRSLTDRIDQRLHRASSETARELGLWLDERLDDLNVSASSFVVSENLARMQQPRQSAEDLARLRDRLRDYLNSVRQHFADYEALLVFDPRGRVVTSSSGRTGRVLISLDQLNGLRKGDALVGDAYWDATLGKAALILAVPIREADGRFLGTLAAKMNLDAVRDLLQRLSPREPGDLFLITDEGRLVVQSRLSSAELMRASLPAAATSALLDQGARTVVYEGAGGEEVIAALRRAPRLRWAAVAEIPQAEVSRQVGRLRTVTALVTFGLLAGVGILALVLVLLIVRPLDRLNAAASRAAAGDLSVDLPARGGGEVGYLTQVFNALIGRLRERESQGELERLSLTDSLTGLYNRRHLMVTLASEVQRSRRLRRPFSVLLADIDHFKMYNDAHGHLAGDAALARIAEILRKTTRAVDCVARYGGEEFVIVLLETTIVTASAVAERIRARVAAEVFDDGRLTVSIGAAECPAHGDTPESLIASADAAMYQAKREGRDRVAVASEQPGPERKKRRRKREA